MLSQDKMSNFDYNYNVWDREFFSGTIYTQDSFLKLSKALCDNVTPVCMATYFRKTFRFV